MEIKSYIFMILVSALLSSCSASHDAVNQEDFTLSSGIKITENVQQCDAVKIKKESQLDKLPDQSYLLTISNYFSCDGQEQVYMTLNTDKKASLVFYSKGDSSCECFKELKVKISPTRVDPNNILYVVYDNEVLAHFIVP